MWQEKALKLKIRMSAYMYVIMKKIFKKNEEIFEIVHDSSFIPVKKVPTTENSNVGVITLKSSWSVKLKENILYSSLDDNLFESMVNCTSAEEVWVALIILHEIPEEVRNNK